MNVEELVSELDAVGRLHERRFRYDGALVVATDIATIGLGGLSVGCDVVTKWAKRGFA